MEKSFKVILEIELTGKDVIDAVNGFIDEFIEEKNNLTYIVKDVEENKTYSVDLSEDIDDQILPYNDYVAFN